MKMLAALLGMLLMLLPLLVQAEKRLYQWRDAAGRLHFSDTAPPDGNVSSSRPLKSATVLPAGGESRKEPPPAPAAPVATAPAAPQGNAPDASVQAQVASLTLQARVAQAMALVSPVKVMVVEFYMEQGRWPTDISALVPDAAELREPGVVDRVALGSAGEIVVTLSPQLSPKGWLRLTPANRSVAVTWSCSSNLPASALGGPDGFCRSVAR